MMRIGSKKLRERYGMRKLTLNLCALFLAFCFAAQVWAASDDVPAGPKQLPHVSIDSVIKHINNLEVMLYSVHGKNRRTQAQS